MDIFVNWCATVEGRATREELRKQREIEEARRTGQLPKERDEEGNEINPYIPTYIAKAPCRRLSLMIQYMETQPFRVYKFWKAGLAASEKRQ